MQQVVPLHARVGVLVDLGLQQPRLDEGVEVVDNPEAGLDLGPVGVRPLGVADHQREHRRIRIDVERKLQVRVVVVEDVRADGQPRVEQLAAGEQLVVPDELALVDRGRERRLEGDLDAAGVVAASGGRPDRQVVGGPPGHGRARQEGREGLVEVDADHAGEGGAVAVALLLLVAGAERQIDPVGRLEELLLRSIPVRKSHAIDSQFHGAEAPRPKTQRARRRVLAPP
ncbi:hypothetical protein LJR219_000237 [Phenylobacterium sp. LjRoot219]